MRRVIHTEPAEEAPDRVLVTRCQAGDETAFDALVLRHRERAFNIAYPLLLNHEDATEVAQDAFLNVYRNIGEFRGESEFTTWLYQIVTNLARNKRRWWNRRGKKETVSMDCPVGTSEGEIARQVAVTTNTPDTEVVQAEFVKMLNEKMARLAQDQREVLILRTIQDMSYDEIAVMLGCSVGTVKSRISRAREALRQAMAGEL